MKSLKNGIQLFLVAILLIATACASSSSVKQSNKSEGTQGTQYMTLEDHLRRINGVRIVGSGDYAKVVLQARGISNASVGMGAPDNKTDLNMGDSNKRQPLFVIDGQKVGRDFSSVKGLVSAGNIKSVRLLRDSEAARYGSQSGSGVIEIVTKSAGNNK